MFSDFFEQVSGVALTRSQQALMVETIDALHKSEDNQ